MLTTPFLGSAAVALGPVTRKELRGPCGPAGAPVDIIAAIRLRSRPGLDVRLCRLREDEITEVDGVPVTTGLRTAYDLGRLAERVLAVVAVDALGRVCGFSPADVAVVASRHPGTAAAGSSSR